MLDQADHIDAIFLVARHGRSAQQIAESRSMLARIEGDAGEARRWRGIRCLIRRAVAR